MTVLNIVLLCCGVLCFGLYVFSSIIKLNVLRKIFGCLVLPCFAVLNIRLLSNYLPDSVHIIYFSVVALFFIFLTEIFYVFGENKLCEKALKVSVFFISFVFAQLYKSVLYIINVPARFTIVLLAIYLAILVSVFAFSERKKLSQYVSFSLVYFQTALLDFLSLVYLFFLPRMQSALLFCGTFLLLILVCFYFIFHSEKNFKFKNLLCFILFILSQLCIMYSNLLIFQQ